MDCALFITAPKDAEDAAGAMRVFEEFFDQYQSILVSAEDYFERIMQQVQPQFSQAYAPWQRSVKDLLQGVHMVAKKIPVRNPKGLADALRLFSLDSAIAMLHDVCISCKIKISGMWAESFKKNIQALSEAFRVLMQHQVIARVR